MFLYRPPEHHLLEKENETVRHFSSLSIVSPLFSPQRTRILLILDSADFFSMH